MLSRFAKWLDNQHTAATSSAPPEIKNAHLREVSAPSRPAYTEQQGGLACPESAPTQGLLEEPELREFFALNHFGLGRHNGATYRTREALDRGRASIIAKFQNCVERVSQRKETQLRRLKDTLLEIEGVSETTSRRVRQAVECLEGDKETLSAQFDAAHEAAGWVAQTFCDYETGFAKGIYEAVTSRVNGGHEQ